MGALGIVLIIVGVVIFSIIVWYVSTMNGIRRLSLKCDEASSGIDIALTKRYDVLTKQLEVVKEYTSHEARVLYETIRLRSGMSIQEKQQALEMMNNASNQFRLTAEAYPQLLSSETYKMLMVSIADCEEHLQAARRLYNANVNAYTDTHFSKSSSDTKSGIAIVIQRFVNADFAGDMEQNLWSFTIDHPSVGFNLEASGNQQGKMGSFCFYFNNLYRLGDGFLVQLDYAVEDDGLIATALVTPGRLGNYVATLVLGEQQLNLTVKNTAGRKLFWLNLRADEDRQLKYGYMEYQPNPMVNPFNTRPNAAQSKITAEYDGEKLVINQNGVTITCTGAFESDHAYVTTLHAEGETVRPEENEAYIRCEYEGEEGNFAFSGRVIDPTGQDALVLRFACAPTEGMNELLREKDGVIRLTPETLQMLLQQ